MKKLLLTLIVSIAFCGTIFAQYESHWPGFYDPDYADQTPFVAAIVLNGNIVTAADPGWDALEIAFFVDDECRGNENYLYNGYVEEYGDPFPIIDGVPLYFNTANEVVTVRMYDHMNEIEYNECVVTYLGEPYEILTGGDHYQGWLDPENPIMLNFTSSNPTPEVIVWNDPADWPSGIPEPGTPVVIPDNTVVIVPEGYVANPSSITMGTGCSIIIEEGGQLYHEVDLEVTMQMDTVEGYNSKGGAGYRLFACPVSKTSTVSTKPIAETNLTEGVFDFYKFSEGAADGLEWINYKGMNFDADPTDVQFGNLAMAEGYLYASATQKTNITMSGFTTSTAADNSKVINLTKTPNAEFEGLNLVGNPFTCQAYVSNASGDMPYYEVNPAGDGLNPTAVVAGTPIGTMKGVFVVATADNEQCTFKTVATSSSKGANLNITVNQGRGMVDNAIISFGAVNTLKKFQFNPNHTKVYIPQDGEDYAVVGADDMGEMPVNFKAESNGSYTMNFTSENVQFGYLHLIDNMTGAEVDLLSTPYYTFNAKSTDYASRFKLVYVTADNGNEDNFAFFSNGSFVIDNEGAATLQVIDVTGRMISSESINGCANVSVNAAAGVYMIRLVNGNDVKVQKVVIR